MKIHRFWVEGVPSGSDVILKTVDFIHQIKDVLQLEPGEHIQLFNEHEEKKFQITLVNKKEIRLKILGDITPLPKPRLSLHVAVSLLKGDSWEDIIRECTPLGVKDFQPLICERTIVRELTPSKLRRYVAIARESAEQSGWRHIPNIFPPRPFEEWIFTRPKRPVLFHHPGDSLTHIPLAEEMTLIIGPEGGWTEHELSLAKGNGIIPVSLTPATLTARLAPVVACSSLLSLASHQ